MKKTFRNIQDDQYAKIFLSKKYNLRLEIFPRKSNLICIMTNRLVAEFENLSEKEVWDKTKEIIKEKWYERV